MYNLIVIKLYVLPLDKAIAAGAVVVIVSKPNGLADGRTEMLLGPAKITEQKAHHYCWGQAFL